MSNQPALFASANALEYLAASHEDPKNPGALKKVLFSGSATPSGKLQMVNWARIPANTGFTRHYHEDMHEVFIVMSGQAEMIAGEQTFAMKNGDAILIPPGTIHSMKALEGKEVDYIVFGISEGKGGKTVNV